MKDEIIDSAVFPNVLEEERNSSTYILSHFEIPGWQAGLKMPSVSLSASTEPHKEVQDFFQSWLTVCLNGDGNLHALVEANLAQGKALRDLVEISDQQNKSLQSIAQPNMADWMGAGANIAMALLAVYAAVKVRSVFEDRQDDKVYAELEKLWEMCDEVSQDLENYFLFFPFRLAEPVTEWNENEEVRQKVESFLNFSDGQSEKMKRFRHVLKGFERNIHRLGWKIHPKCLNEFKSLLDATEQMFSSLGNYNCSTAQLFRIDKQFIGMSMFMGFEELEWDERFSAIDRNLVGYINSVNELKDKIIAHIALLEKLSARKKFILRGRFNGK